MKSVSTYKDEADAYAQIEEAGYHAVPMNFSALKNDYHWHDFDSLIYRGWLLHAVSIPLLLVCGLQLRHLSLSKLVSSFSNLLLQLCIDP